MSVPISVICFQVMHASLVMIDSPNRRALLPKLEVQPRTALIGLPWSPVALTRISLASVMTTMRAVAELGGSAPPAPMKCMETPLPKITRSIDPPPRLPLPMVGSRWA